MGGPGDERSRLKPQHRWAPGARPSPAPPPTPAVFFKTGCTRSEGVWIREDFVTGPVAQRPESRPSATLTFRASMSLWNSASQNLGSSEKIGPPSPHCRAWNPASPETSFASSSNT